MSESKNRKLWFKIYGGMVRLFIKKPEFRYLHGDFTETSMILSNHVGAKAPLKWELHYDKEFRFWGTYEMNGSFGSVYHYLSRTYFHKKKHINLFFSILIAIIATPFLWLFYRGMKLIPTYRDIRFKTTLKESYATVSRGTNLVIFPEDSANGYFDKLTYFFCGFAMLAEDLLRKGIDMPIVVAYFRRKENVFLIDKVGKFSELRDKYQDKDEIAKAMRLHMNSLADLEI